jgi:hypothetical protein
VARAVAAFILPAKFDLRTRDTKAAIAFSSQGRFSSVSLAGIFVPSFKPSSSYLISGSAITQY